MKSSNAMVIVPQVYDWVESAVWAALTAFVLYFLIHILPDLPENARRAASLRAASIAAQNRSYCEKWGMKPGTRAHAACAMDLQALRRTIEQDIADDSAL